MCLRNADAWMGYTLKHNTNECCSTLDCCTCAGTRKTSYILYPCWRSALLWHCLQFCRWQMAKWRKRRYSIFRNTGAFGVGYKWGYPSPVAWWRKSFWWHRDEWSLQSTATLQLHQWDYCDSTSTFLPTLICHWQWCHKTNTTALAMIEQGSPYSTNSTSSSHTIAYLYEILVVLVVLACLFAKSTTILKLSSYLY